MPKQNDLPTPVTTNQKFLAKAAGMDVELPTAVTMDQMYLQAIAEGSGGGTTDAYTKAETNALLNEKADLVDGKVPASQLPSYVDDVLEYASTSSFPATGESGKIYVATDTNRTYRWGGSAYAEISESLALGETASTAYPGNKGKANADAIAKKPGEITSGKQYTIDGQTVTAGTGAEAFNDLVNNKAAGNNSHAEGQRTIASGIASHAEGMATTASGHYSHAEGSGTIASGVQSHAEGNMTTASVSYSHAEGNGTKASSPSQHVQGKYNEEDANGKFAFIIGNGANGITRHNAFAVDWNGLIYVNGATTGVDVSALDPSNLSSAVPVAKGGTGATSASSARSNLGLGDAATYSATSSVTSGSSSLVTSGAVYSTLFPRTATISAETNTTISYQDTAFISNVFIFNITVKSSSDISSGSSVPLLSFGLGTLTHTNSRAITCTAGDIPQRAWYNGADGKIYMKPTNSVTADSSIFLSGMIVI